MIETTDARNGFALFDSNIGHCGIAWGEHGIVGVQLPEAHRGATHARLVKRFPQLAEVTPPDVVQHAIDDVVALLAGEARDLSPTKLDMRGVPEFEQRVYAVTRQIPPGKTLTYGELAKALDAPGAAQAIGQALGRNPFALIVPCHRVVAAGGKLGGFTANGGANTKLKILTIEGARTMNQLELFQ
ncbi:MAG: methylated-DNA--[protein]-cysteine S-methyltransferase [Gammaproteobacteria bacterium]|nr:methylated-DNA--[protein]-cysteine S-methyltransferase [Gammaproteobacteria bacterium]